jgi:hypothetical protein
MKTIITRLRRLEDAHVPEDQDRAIVEAILKARHRREGADYKPPVPLPPASFDGCRTLADRICRTRHLHMQRALSPRSR